MTQGSKSTRSSRFGVSNELHSAVRYALRPAQPWLSAGVVAASLAGAIPFAVAEPFPAVFPLASLLPSRGGDGSEGFVIEGNTLSQLGRSVSAAGDINGDGIDDLIIGAPGASGGGSASGDTYVVFGSTLGFPAVFS
jgi:hypothetical protein